MNDASFERDSRNTAVARVVGLLAAGQFAASASGSRVTPEQLEAAIAEYGRRLTPLPAHAYELIDYAAIADSELPAWSVVVPLFTEEEGRSDLSLELELVRQRDGRYETSVDNLHVL